MRKRALIVSLLFTALVFGQVEPNSVTVSVSRNANLQPDQVVFFVTVQSPLSTNLEDVLASLQGSSITMANLAGVNTFFAQMGLQTIPTLQWTFNLAVPFAQMKAAVASLNAFEQSIGQGTRGLTLSFIVQGTLVSQQLAASQTCSFSGLFSDAQAQAQTLASAAGATVGPVLALSSSAASASGPLYVGLSSFLVSASAPPCAMTVRFSLLRN